MRAMHAHVVSQGDFISQRSSALSQQTNKSNTGAILPKLSERAIALLRLGSRTSYRSVRANRARQLPNRHELGCDEVRHFVFAGQLEAENRLLLLRTIRVRNALVLA
jgi:hypothetical protein